MSKFQLIIIGLFILFIIAGVFIFATFRGDGANNQLPAITIWGTFPAKEFNDYVSSVSINLSTPLRVTYSEKSKNSFSQEFIAALARGRGPDAILIPADTLLPHLDKVTPVPYAALDQRSFMDAYIQEGEIYLGANGTNALPFVIDPLIMYWNRDTFSSVGLATYPKYWDEFTALNQKITVKDQNGNLRRSTVAMGDFNNVINARELLGSLILQSGNTITKNDQGIIVSALNSSPSPSAPIQFFTQFVDPNSPSYSWNRGMPDSKTAFLSQVLATYFGFASELRDIQNKNPNLNFDAAPLPQFRSGAKAVYGKLYGFSIVRTAANPNGVYQILSILLAPQYLGTIANTMYLPSVRRDIIVAGSSDPYIAVFNEQALITRTWLDADPSQSAGVFSTMINAITSGAKSVRDAISDANDRYDVALRQAVQ